MLCAFCSDFDLDQLATPEGLKHHASCAALLQSAEDGCEGCQLIRETQELEFGGDLTKGNHDLGPEELQIIARVHQKPGDYTDICFSQEKRFRAYQSLVKAQKNISNGDVLHRPPTEFPFLWSFVPIAARSEDPSSRYLRLRYLGDRNLDRMTDTASHLSTIVFPCSMAVPIETAFSSWFYININVSLALWLQNCLRRHNACSSLRPHDIQPPKRVIDVGSSDGSAEPFLHISGDDVQDWVALSHCWGAHQPLKTIKESLADHRRCIPMKNLPRTFYDAVLITRAMGYRFLWIDSLCIVQDSAEDWMHEIANMGNIYKYCVFTISAEIGHDSSAGILGYSEKIYARSVQHACHSTRENFSGTLHSFARGSVQEYSGTLQRRAWVLQERILSPRTLIFNPKQMAWTCRCAERSEENPRGYSTANGSSLFPTKIICFSIDQLEATRHLQEQKNLGSYDLSPLQLWYMMVAQFCAREITFQEDSLPAISGLAREVRRHTGHAYIAGIWAEDIHNGILWSVTGAISLPSTLVAPSWSWASIKRGVLVSAACIGPAQPRLFHRHEGRQTKLPFHLSHSAKILQTDIVQDGENEFGPISSGTLLVRAPFHTVNSFERDQIKLPLREIHYHPSFYLVQPNTMVCWLDQQNPIEDEETANRVARQLHESSAVLLQITSVMTNRVVFDSSDQERNGPGYKNTLLNQNYALILEPVIESEGNWRRIGIARIADGLVDGWQIKEVTIV